MMNEIQRIYNTNTTFKLSISSGLITVVGTGFIGITMVDADITFSNQYFVPTVNSVTSVQRGEFTNDGLLDFAILEQSGKMATYRSLGNDQYIVEAKVEGQGNLRENLRLGDVDGNGTIDYVWNKSATIFVYFTHPDGSLLRLDAVYDINTPVDIELSNIDQDGDLDIITTSQNSARTFRNAGNNGFILIDTLSLPDPKAADIATGDFDHDGDIDIAVLSTYFYNSSYYGLKVYDSHVSVFLNDGSGIFNTQGNIQLPYGNQAGDGVLPQRMDVGDLDNDGDLDVAITSGTFHYSDSSEILLLENIANASSFKIKSRIVYSAFAQYPDRMIFPIQMADFDLDGDLDFVASTGIFMRIFRNDNNFQFVMDTKMTSGVQFVRSIRIDDFNQDGVYDMLVGGETGVVIFDNLFIPDTSLQVDPLISGQSTIFTVTAAQPGKEVFWLYRRGLPVEEAPVAELGGLILEVGSQFSVAGSAIVDDNGTAELNIPVPNDAPSDMITIQAVIQGDPDGTNSRKTNFHTTRIQP